MQVVREYQISLEDQEIVEFQMILFLLYLEVCRVFALQSKMTKQSIIILI